VAKYSVQYFLAGAVILKITKSHLISIQHCFLNHTIYGVRHSAVVHLGTRSVSFSENVRPLLNDSVDQTQLNAAKFAVR
jgi:hypothetical protein